MAKKTINKKPLHKKIQGYAEVFIKSINGSYSNVVGLPLFQTNNLLGSVGLIKS
jgi:predicted house-cleaning NTP pyrophosphatase (Maf/HAM1 superfamily)